MYKSDPVLFYIIVCVAVFFIIGLNVSLFSWVKNNSLKRQIKNTRSMLKRIQNPWEEEDKDLDQLHQIVNTLNQNTDQDQK